MDVSRHTTECKQAAEVFGVIPDIHPEDFIFEFMAEHPDIGAKGKAAEEYFKNGADSTAKLRKLLTDVCLLQGDNIGLLEFASGYGCVSRHIPRLIPSCNVTACDIHEQAMTFIKEKLKIDVLLSKSAPEDFNVATSYDVVFALSFFFPHA